MKRYIALFLRLFQERREGFCTVFFAYDTILFTRTTEQEAEAVKHIIKVYEATSGQRINLEKTEVTVSANVSGELQSKLKDILGVQVVEQHYKYLGLPTLIGKRKKEVFACIVDKIVQKMKDWKERTLSQAGREVLIKTVLQAIPMYSMNCFLFPVTTCQEIEKATARFFWGSTLEDRKTHWAAWDILTSAKANGGMGFRELRFFNIAMLAKQLWKLLQHPTSLTHRILKAKYFPRHNIMVAGVGFQPSFMWRSLLAARTVVEDGMAWRVGNGKQINMAEDRWIGVDNPSRPERKINEEWRRETVSKLIDVSTSRWNRERVHQIFSQSDSEQIFGIPLGNAQVEDRRIWRFTKHGGFTVKSAYHRAVQNLSNIHNDRAACSSTPKEWKKIWKINAIPRVRLFIWRACRKALPTKENLLRHGGNVDPICEICGEAVETIDHLLLHCTEAKKIWYGSVLRIAEDKLQGYTFKEFLWMAMNHYPSGYVSQLAYNAWELWKARNQSCSEEKRISAQDIIQKAHTQWREFDVLQRETIRAIPHRAHNKWEKPKPGKLKLNCDVATQDGRRVGFGFTLRDATGMNILAANTEEEARGSSTLLEGLAMRHALQRIRQYGLKADSVESDNKQLIDGINGRGTPEVYCEVIIGDIKQLAQEMQCTEFSWNPRQSNRVAHQVAQGPEFISINHTPAHLLCYFEDDVNE